MRKPEPRKHPAKRKPLRVDFGGVQSGNRISSRTRYFEDYGPDDPRDYSDEDLEFWSAVRHAFRPDD